MESILTTSTNETREVTDRVTLAQSTPGIREDEPARRTAFSKADIFIVGPSTSVADRTEYSRVDYAMVNREGLKTSNEKEATSQIKVG